VVRIYQAKYMLLTTPVSITDISFAVGYNSVGSFTSHFTGSVSVPPSLFRQKAQNGDFTDPEPWTRRTALVGGRSPVSVAAGTATRAPISLRPRRTTDPPVLLALPDLEAGTARFRTIRGQADQHSSP